MFCEELYKIMLCKCSLGLKGKATGMNRLKIVYPWSGMSRKEGYLMKKYVRFCPKIGAQLSYSYSLLLHVKGH